MTIVAPVLTLVRETRLSMSGLLLPILASALATPEVDAIFIRNLDREAGAGTLMVEIFVSPDHAVEGCGVVVSTYTAERNQRVCDQAREMRVPIVAKDLDGTPVHGFVTVARIARSGNGPRGAPPDLEPAYAEIGVVDLPGRYSRKAIYLTVLADAEGVMTHCEGGSDGKDRALADVACRELGGNPLPVMRDGQGAAVPYVKTLRVDFTEQPAKS